MKRGNVIISEGMQKFYPGQKTSQQDYYAGDVVPYYTVTALYTLK